jgi:hypothetical protein
MAVRHNRLRRRQVHRRVRVCTTRRQKGGCGARAEGRGVLLRLRVWGIVRIRLTTLKLLWATVRLMGRPMVRRRLSVEAVFWTLSVRRR